MSCDEPLPAMPAACRTQIFQGRSSRLRSPVCGSSFTLPDAVGLFRGYAPGLARETSRQGE